MSTNFDIQRRIILKLKLHGLIETGIVAPILLHELTYNDTKLVQGWVRVDVFDNDKPCWHLWCETKEGTELDIIRNITIAVNPGFAHCNTILIREEPKEFEKNDELLEQWKLYKDNPKDFWSSQPKKVQDFRRKIFSQYRTKNM
tara:strand:+ start:49 stop:480 length:432 start_codon:yes stop_codon:yes gene_type:complete